MFRCGLLVFGRKGITPTRGGFCGVCAVDMYRLRWSRKMPKGGFEPPVSDDTALHRSDTFTTQLQQIQPNEETTLPELGQQNDISKHQNNICLHKKCVICVSRISEDLALLVRTWDTLPAAVQAGIVAMVKAVRPQWP